MQICGINALLRQISYAQRAREQRQTCSSLKFNLSHKLQLLKVQHNFCSLMCYTVLIWTLILLTLGNNILLQSFNWPKPVPYVMTDKTNASICIRIRRILKVRIRIRWMQILASFVTSLNVRDNTYSLLSFEKQQQLIHVHEVWCTRISAILQIHYELCKVR